ncbi:MAG TPA: hypothetical protein VGA67_01940 [Candidatus Dojkabacteria bacterium]
MSTPGGIFEKRPDGGRVMDPTLMHFFIEVVFIEEEEEEEGKITCENTPITPATIVERRTIDKAFYEITQINVPVHQPYPCVLVIGDITSYEQTIT